MIITPIMILKRMKEDKSSTDRAHNDGDDFKFY